ncbi:hypothetical protein BU25DRAFT_417787 [Macroventuria anomochaeta]|uniref:Uncharacterized protein n=1 Tax=Macroventuria anomochaeta TaxID=301207 RepID=A0ACB6SFD0_9PLEO|nr:uncharacterized protein BU25DRAFT_417787 [Macroventuria anomochaeta]KAF2632024.1 hypothetical protein BU25DRAFT_417787 [Macroventuria anomochaeta]
MAPLERMLIVMDTRWIDKHVSLVRLRGEAGKEAVCHTLMRRTYRGWRRGFDTSGLTPAASIRQVAPSYQKQSTRCYRWYQESNICFAYLKDVTIEFPYRNGQWPMFDCSHGAGLFKNSLRHGSSSSSRMTGHSLRIHAQALAHRPLDSVSVAQRMSWASSRMKTRPKDIAYGLLGLFDVNMPLLLQKEIIKESDDQPLFAWSQTRTRSDMLCGLLADFPANFASASAIVLVRDLKISNPYSGRDMQFLAVDEDRT